MHVSPATACNIAAEKRKAVIPEVEASCGRLKTRRGARLGAFVSSQLSIVRGGTWPQKVSGGEMWRPIVEGQERWCPAGSVFRGGTSTFSGKSEGTKWALLLKRQVRRLYVFQCKVDLGGHHFAKSKTIEADCADVMVAKFARDVHHVDQSMRPGYTFRITAPSGMNGIGFGRWCYREVFHSVLGQRRGGFSSKRSCVPLPAALKKIPPIRPIRPPMPRSGALAQPPFPGPPARGPTVFIARPRASPPAASKSPWLQIQGPLVHVHTLHCTEQLEPAEAVTSGILASEGGGSPEIDLRADERSPRIKKRGLFDWRRPRGEEISGRRLAQDGIPAAAAIWTTSTSFQAQSHATIKYGLG
ncbi:hypothetical protein C8R44DRAFT_853666 [Mycena epipterygia]|nr:hypothetical protein C8R44DRAFT_853666 [Mycena epipterygia]